MDSAELVILETELAAQAREIERIYERIEERARLRTASGTESLSYQLHNLYSAFEELFEIVARTFENHLAGNAGYHVELLRRMNVAVEGVRPAIVQDELLPFFDSLRSFRHFFRDAYAHEIDRRKVVPVLADARRIRAEYPKMVDRFLASLGKADRAPLGSIKSSERPMRRTGE